MSQTTTKRRRRQSGAGYDRDAVDVVDAIVRLPIDKLHRNPHNRLPSEQQVAAMAASLAAEGQKEPIVVRPGNEELPLGHYQLISGETRTLAARHLGWDSIEARVREQLDDAAALRELAVANACREDLDPIQRGKLLSQLIRPADQGGGGMPAAEAGAIFGLASESGVRNALQLLRLPAAWQARVVSGEIPESVARILVPYAEHAPLMKAFERSYRDRWERERFWGKREDAQQKLRLILDRETRPVDKRKKHSYGWKLGGDHPRYFELTPELEAELQIVELPVGKNGKHEQRALNVKAYDRRQLPLVEKKLKQREDRRKSKGKTTGADKPQTPQAKAADDRRRREEADRKTAERIRLWRHRFLRLLISEQLEAGDWRVGLILLHLVAEARDANYYRPLPWGEFTEPALRAVQGQFGRDPLPAGMAGWELAVASVDPDGDPVSMVDTQLLVAVKYVLWPQGSNWRGGVDGTLPETLPSIDYAVIESMAELLLVDIRHGWKRAAINRSREQAMLTEFLELHTRPQLEDLAGELEVADQLAGCSSKGAIVAKLLELHMRLKPLRLPKSIESAATKARKVRRKR